MGVGLEVSLIPIHMIQYHCTDSYLAIYFLIQFLPAAWNGESMNLTDEMVNLWIFTLGLTSAECQCHTSSVWRTKSMFVLYLSRRLMSGQRTTRQEGGAGDDAWGKWRKAIRWRTTQQENRGRGHVMMPRAMATAMMGMRRNTPCGGNDNATLSTCVNSSCIMQQPTNDGSSKGGRWWWQRWQQHR